MKPWLALIAAIVAAALLAGTYAYGRSDGRAIERDKQAEARKAVEADRKQREQRVDQVAGGAAAAETQRQDTVREIYRESHTVTERPVYRNVCVDADGMRLLDRAAGAANGADPGSGSAGAGQGAAGEPQP
jgi:Ni/Co efflux regulator RcnB